MSTTTTEAAGLIRCDTPGHGNVTSTADTWETEGWGVFMGLRRCPECTKLIEEGPTPPDDDLAPQIMSAEEWEAAWNQSYSEAPLTRRPYSEAQPLRLPYERWMAPAYRAAGGDAAVITILKRPAKAAAPESAPDGDAA